MIARSATPPVRKPASSRAGAANPQGLAAIEIARPRQALARLSPRTGRGVRDRDRRRLMRRRPGWATNMPAWPWPVPTSARAPTRSNLAARPARTTTMSSPWSGTFEAW